MKITNIHNLPRQLYDLANQVYKPREEIIRVTELIGPSMIRYLRIKHWDELAEDAVERLWAVVGSCMHAILSHHEYSDSFVEERLSIRVDNQKITGQIDNFVNGYVEDWKMTSVWSFLNGVKSEWVSQLNVYAELWDQAGFTPVGLRIHAILRDWMKSKALYDSGYPETQYVLKNIGMWDKDKRIEFIKLRIVEHNNPSECTDEEKWSKSTTYAIKKEGRKSAVRVLNTLHEAEEYLKICDNKHSIEVRQGEHVRCKSYCPVRLLCPYNIYRGEIQ